MTRRLLIAVLALAGVAFVIQGSWIQAKAALAQVLLQRAWADTLADGGEHRPWPWADFWPVARLQVARLGIDLVVLAGDTGNVLAFGPGHNSRSGQPGSAGTVVVSGHRDTHFRFLPDLQSGDAVVLTTPQLKAVYAVQDAAPVDSRTTRLRIDPNARQLLLTTCYPFDTLAVGGPLRYVVTAMRKTDAAFGRAQLDGQVIRNPDPPEGPNTSSARSPTDNRYSASARFYSGRRARFRLKQIRLPPTHRELQF